jgi:CRISPR-associated protein (TIGR02584 family)
MTQPADYPGRILLAVTELTPQIITENLFALAVDRRLWVPTEVRIITTRQGAEKAQRKLLSGRSRLVSPAARRLRPAGPNALA